jgi:putative spermidine/putrescine transport system permease protein
MTPTIAASEEGERWLALPLVAFFLVFFVSPLVLMVLLSMMKDAGFDWVGPAQDVKFITDPFSIAILFDTLRLGAEVTIICLLLGYPLAWLIVRAPRWAYGPLLLVIMLPLLTSVVVGTFAWIVILGRQGLVNNLLLQIGLLDAPLRLLYTEGAVALALAQIMMPLMVLPLIASFRQLDPMLSEASTALGASDWRTFFHVTLPLTLPGAVAGSMLVYAGAVTAFVTQTIVGGGRLIYMPLYIYQQAISLNDWPFAAAVSVVLLAAVLLVVSVFNVLGRATSGDTAG